MNCQIVSVNVIRQLMLMLAALHSSGGVWFGGHVQDVSVSLCVLEKKKKKHGLKTTEQPLLDSPTEHRQVCSVYSRPDVCSC